MAEIMKGGKIFVALLGLALTGPSQPANAALISFNLSYSGAPFGNGATATGSITFDDTILPVPGDLGNVPAAALGITAFSITVAGASAGNGTFGLTDVTNWIWSVGSGLDLSQELVGQASFFDFNWCGAGFDDCVPPAPGGVGTLIIQANAERNELMRLHSMAPTAVPEPATVALFAFGLAGLKIARRRRIAT